MSDDAAPTLAPALLKSDAAARWLGVSARTLWAMSAPRGELPVARVGHSVRYRLQDLQDYAAKLAAESLTAAGQ